MEPRRRHRWRARPRHARDVVVLHDLTADVHMRSQECPGSGARGTPHGLGPGPGAPSDGAVSSQNGNGSKHM